jgi:hypothetical protein
MGWGRWSEEAGKVEVAEEDWGMSGREGERADCVRLATSLS